MYRKTACTLVAIVALAACGDDGSVTAAQKATATATVSPTTAAPTTIAPTTIATTTTTLKPVDPAAIAAKFVSLTPADMGAGFAQSKAPTAPDTAQRQTNSKAFRDDPSCAPMADFFTPLPTTARYFDSWARPQPNSRIVVEVHVSDVATTAGAVQTGKSQLPLVTSCVEKMTRTFAPDFKATFAGVPLPTDLSTDGVWVHQTADSDTANLHFDAEFLILASGPTRVHVIQLVNARGTFDRDEFLRIGRLVAQRLATATRV